jgi:hypothetical protein
MAWPIAVAQPGRTGSRLTSYRTASGLTLMVDDADVEAGVGAPSTTVS